MRLIREIWYDENDRKHIKEIWDFSANPQPQIGHPIDQISPYTYPKSSKKNNLIYESEDFCSHSLPIKNNLIENVLSEEFNKI